MHPVGADEDFGDLAVRAHDRRVQRLVQVELGGGDEVLELGDHRGETGVEFAEDRVAVGVLGDEHQQASEVAAAQFAAFDPDAVHGDEVARPDEHFGGDVRFAEHPGHPVRDGGERVGGSRGGDHGAGVRVLLGVEDGEDEVLQLGLERLDTEPFGERDQYVAGDLGDPGLLLGAHHAERAHVVQPVGELDRHHPDVVAGGDEHLAEGLRLGGGPVVDLLQLGHAVDEVADLLAELLPHLVESHLRVLDRVVEEGRGQGGGLGAELGEDEGDRERVGDVGLAALAHLSAVRALREDVGPVQHGEIGVGMVGPVRLGDMADGVRQPVPGGRTEQGDPAEPAEIDPGTAPPADGSTWVGGLCAHGAPPATSTGGGKVRSRLRAGA